ncbi:leucine-rich repeat-containing protein kinase family protein [Variovorax sp. J22G21]|uniref:leucine-rich repeat-containing protein kinase family protein n=1 Tax=Variovorax fucosicus TaxID=3053517 RepID=UPI002574AB48|nr:MULTISPECIES: leucine-rich repeat-containing protein kinase family protein [unclassified Variovorax]MDM0042467.1 leucine-rich repeat-containing protein kinase family protein [Variovorax sp. J22R193]MDM0061072.1 leucine-rich repeat-containing protein kinase family protein [Variovorax sp. J22G21]
MGHTLAQLRTGELAGLRRLDLGCGLTEFPHEIFDLSDSLEVLNLSGNALDRLPDDIARLHRLRVLFCSDNQFTALPASLGACPALEMIGFKANRIHTVPAAALPDRLRWLILTDNAIDALPAGWARFTRLQKLMLAGNCLRALPDDLAGCRRLELLRIAANRFESLPDWLLQMPRLAWLACAGNPFSDANEAAALSAQTVPRIDWSQLTLQQRLGEGASGVIHQALWRRGPGAGEPVAVKLFKGAVTSDGLPHSEMAACMAAGEHPGLIPVHGRVGGHPQGTDGLVLALVAPSFGNLAGPPSLESCTRDIYADDAGWPLPTALAMARRIASAARQLHARGILHGDLYAHNILHDGQGQALLGDFGAASFVGLGPQAAALERIEARAFGCLLEELLDRCTGVDPGTLAPWRALQQRCLGEEVALRPGFEAIEAALMAG